MIQDGGENPHDRLERVEGICASLHRIDSELGCGMPGGGQAQRILIRCTWANSVFREFCLFVPSHSDD